MRMHRIKYLEGMIQARFCAPHLYLGDPNEHQYFFGEDCLHEVLRGHVNAELESSGRAEVEAASCVRMQQVATLGHWSRAKLQPSQSSRASIQVCDFARDECKLATGA